METPITDFFKEQLKTEEGIEKLAKRLATSRTIAPDYYEKLSNGDIEWKKPKLDLIILAMLKTEEVGMPLLHGMRVIYPTEAGFSVKSVGLKSMVVKSGLLGAWEESWSGESDDLSREVKITAARNDTGETATRSFSLLDAQKASLIPADISGASGWKRFKNPYLTYSDRMLYARAVGFVINDLFSDVVGGLVSYEEAMSIPSAEFVKTETKTGQTLSMHNDKSEYLDGQSKKLTGGVAARAAEMNKKSKT